jgi:hypothetical protein
MNREDTEHYKQELTRLLRSYQDMKQKGCHAMTEPFIDAEIDSITQKIDELEGSLEWADILEDRE